MNTPRDLTICTDVCALCRRGPPLDNVALWRMNDKGEPAIWACTDHRTSGFWEILAERSVKS